MPGHPPAVSRTVTTRGHPSRDTPDDPHLPTALRACARGFYPAEASAELLISHGSFLARSDFADRFIHVGTSITDGVTTMAQIDWPAAITALDTGGIPAQAASLNYRRCR